MKYRLLLLLAALIWGFAFAAQVVGMESVGPYTFNGVRFLLGSLALVPIILTMKEEAPPLPKNMPLSAACLMVGLPLFAGATLQQVGLQYTTASKASFLTATYILMVPIIGIFLKETLRITHIAGALLAMTGVYFMSITEDFSIGAGDLMMLLCALGFTIQIHAMTYLTQRFSPIVLSSGQFFVAGVLNFILALFFETPTLSGIEGALWPILYTGLLSTGVAYTLQAVGQKYLPPTEASMILSMEMVFGGIAGIFFLDESFTTRQMIGVLSMTAGVFLSQLPGRAVLSFKKVERQGDIRL